MSAERSAMRRFPPGSYLASIVLLLVLVAAYVASVAGRTQAELRRQLEEKGLALAEAIETASRGAIRGNALVEELVARRLLDNARLVDRLLEVRPLDRTALAEIAAANRLRRIDLLDAEGRPLALPAAPAGPGRHMGLGMRMAPGHGPSAGGRPGPMLHMWGRRWSGPAEDQSAEGPGERLRAPAILRDRKFWEGSLFGVAVEARSFAGIVAVHADAAFVLDFRREIGVERQIEEIGRHAGVEEVALLGPGLVVLGHSDPRRIGSSVDDPVLAEAARAGRGLSRLVEAGAGGGRFEVVRPLQLDAGRPGLLAIGLSTEPMRQARRRDLESAIVLGAAVVVAGALGLAVIFYVQHRSLGEVRALEREVERRERLSALGNLAAAVAHEIRNPLNAVSMGLQRLRREFTPTEGAADYGQFVDLMQGEVRRLDGIVEEFLSLARPLALRRAPSPPADLLLEVAALVEPEAAARGVRVVTEGAAGLPPVPLDRDHMKRVLLNLVLNALDAMPRGGTVTLAAAREREGLRLSVADTGEGIPGDLLPRVFEPYVTTKARGMGLGLAISRRIVEAHGGRIEASSRPGAGSRFTVTLPASPPRGGAGGEARG